MCRKVIQIVGDNHDTIAIVPDYEKAVKYLVDSGWFTESDKIYISEKGLFPVTEIYDKDWKEKITIADIDVKFSFYEVDFVE